MVRTIEERRRERTELGGSSPHTRGQGSRQTVADQSYQQTFPKVDGTLGELVRRDR